MCGIVGVVNGKTSRNISPTMCRAIEQAIMCNSLRGDDSTGVYQVDGKKVYSHKSIASGWDFVRETAVSGILRDIDTAAVTVAHNRAATTGKVSNATAHPFIMDDANGNLLSGVHNGTLYGWDTTTHSVDSEWAFSRIAAVGDDAFEEFNGAYAMVWHVNDGSNTIQLARNAERPLYVGYIKGEGRMLIASEPEMMAWLCKRNFLHLEPEVIELRPHRRYTFSTDDPRDFSSVPLPMWTTVVTPYAGSSTSYYSGRYSPDSQKTSLLTKLVNLLAPAAVEEPFANMPVVAGPVSVTASEGRRRPSGAASYAHPDEVRLARIAEVLDLEVAFLGEVYDEETRTLWGEAELDGETSRAVLRNVRPAMYATIREQAVVVAKVIGAYGQESTIRGVNDMCFVVQLKPVPATIDAAVAAIENAVADARSAGSIH